MKITAELSLYPLQDNPKELIKGYLKELQASSNVTIVTNAVSTQVFGEYDDVMATISSATRTAFESNGGFAVVVKYLNADRSESGFHKA